MQPGSLATGLATSLSLSALATANSKVLSKHDEKWNEMFTKLLAYKVSVTYRKQSNYSCKVPRNSSTFCDNRERIRRAASKSSKTISDPHLLELTCCLRTLMTLNSFLLLLFVLSGTIRIYSGATMLHRLQIGTMGPLPACRILDLPTVWQRKNYSGPY